MTASSLPVQGALVALVVLEIVYLWLRYAAMVALRDSHVAAWAQLVLIAQRLEALEQSGAGAWGWHDDGRDFVYPSRAEASHG